MITKIFKRLQTLKSVPLIIQNPKKVKKLEICQNDKIAKQKCRDKTQKSSPLDPKNCMEIEKL